MIAWRTGGIASQTNNHPSLRHKAFPSQFSGNVDPEYWCCHFDVRDVAAEQIKEMPLADWRKCCSWLVCSAVEPAFLIVHHFNAKGLNKLELLNKFWVVWSFFLFEKHLLCIGLCFQCYYRVKVTQELTEAFAFPWSRPERVS